MLGSGEVHDGSTQASKDLEKANKEPQVPPGYKIVKVRKPDGTIVKVKRAIAPAQASAQKKPAELADAAPVNKPVEAAGTPINKSQKKLSPEQPSSAATTPKAAVTPIEAEKNTSSQKSGLAAPKVLSTAVPVEPKQRSSRPFFRAFAARATAAMIPSIGDIGDIGELHDGDEIVDDGNDSEGYDEDDDEPDGHNHDDNGHGGSTSKHEQIGNNIAMASANGLAAGLSAQPSMNVRSQNGATQKQTKSGFQVNEKTQLSIDEKNIGDPIKPGDPETRSLHKTYSEWTRYVIWFIMIVFPILFMVLGVLTAILPKKDYNGQYAQGLAQAIKIAVSAWPIIFAAIAAQSLRTIASYKVERGIRLMTLEQLMGSNSVASSIKQPFLLGRFDMVTIALLILWSLSPLATQALQRMSYPTKTNSPQNTTVYYLDTWSKNQVFDHKDTEPSEIPYDNIITQFFDASMLPPGQYQSSYQDAWLRPKIPIIEYLNESLADSDGWINPFAATTDSNGSTAYSSNYGIPLEAMQISGAYLFNITSTYLFFTCSDLKKGSASDWNTTGTTFYQHTENMTDATVYLDIIPQNKTKSGAVIFAASVSYDEYLYSLCTFTQTFVDSILSCDNTLSNGQNPASNDYQPPNSDCLVSSMRKTPSPPENTTMGDFTYGFGNAAGSIIENYLYNPTNITSLLGNGTFDLTTISTDDFTKRLARLINTYWQLGFGPTMQDSGLNHLTSALYLATTANCTAAVTVSADAYAVSWGWLAALFICAGILLLAGVASIVLDARTIVPDVLGYASSLARKSRYVDLPKVNSTMSGAERANALGAHRVMLQDVKPKAEVGKVALGSAHAGAKRLEMGRSYR